MEDDMAEQISPGNIVDHSTIDLSMAVTLKELAGESPAIALSGGGTKGDFEVGVVRYLYDQNVRPKIICGTSVGSINALKLAEGESDGKPSSIAGHLRGLPGLEGIWLSLERESDMWLPDPTMNDITAKFANLKAEIAQATSDSDIIKYSAGFSFFAMFPGSPATTTLGYGLAKLSSDATGIIQDATAAMNDLENAVSVANLNPIHATMRKPSSFVLKDLQASGIKLRLAMVALEDGKLRYATEAGMMTERDGTPTASLIPDPKCADPINEQLGQLLEKLYALNSEGVAPDGKPKPGAAQRLKDRAKLQKEIKKLQKALAACPKVQGPQLKVDPVLAALASSSIPVVFPPQQIGGYNYVDGGIRMITPIEPAIKAEATMVFAVAASSPEVDIKTVSPPFEILTIALRTAEDIMINEITARDLFPPQGYAVPVIVIQPENDIHSAMAIDPGLIRIRMAHGYMRADDVVQAYRYWRSPDFPKFALGAIAPFHYLNIAAEFGANRKTLEIIQLRYQIWNAEFKANGKMFVGGQDFPPTPPTVQDDPNGPDGATLAQVRQWKRQLKNLVEERIKAGGKCPPDYQNWWSNWEAHNWKPSPWLREMRATIAPTGIHLGVSTTFTVHGVDVDSGSTITDAHVKIDGVDKGLTGKPITFTFTAKKDIDPGKKKTIVEVPEITVEKAGYQSVWVTPAFGQ
jgi:predicted acylesterase/phospholipase RssA